MEKNIFESLLLEYYGNLLTDKQRDVMKMYLDYDSSLSEIAEELGSSRQAIYDVVKKSLDILNNYESKIGYIKRDNELREDLKECIKELESNVVTNQKTQNAVKILKKWL